jgi:peptidoglycan/LPS O-acetylase OafA/YrhL
MAGYREERFDLLGRAYRPTKYEWAVAMVAIVAGLMMIGMAIFGERGPQWLHDLRQLPMALLMFAMACTYVVRARHGGPDERYSPRALRWVAALFMLIGLLIVAVTLIDFKGA